MLSRFRRRGAGLLAGALLLLCVQIADASSYYPAGPRGPLGISRPTISQQFTLGPGESFKRVEMWLDGARVEPVWDPVTGLIRYTPPVPLAPGRHRVRLVVQVEADGYEYAPVVSEFDFEVTAGAVAALPAPGPEELRALQRVNAYRRAVKLTPLTYSDSLGAAARGHARYLLANPDQAERDPHGEAPGTPLYFGASGGDRAGYFGHTLGTAEVIHFVDRAEEAVEGWMDSLYHRIPLVRPGMKSMGYGLAGKGSDWANVLMAGPGDQTPGVVQWPYPGQVDVPTGWDGAETPDPFRLYPGSRRPVGYTITLTFGGSVQKLTLSNASLVGLEGPVSVMRFHPGNDEHLRDTVALIPAAPLTPGATYQVEMAGQADLGQGARPYSYAWSFRTAAEHRPQLKRGLTRSTAGGDLREIEVEGEGFGQGMRLFLGGLPVEGLKVESARRLTFRPPAGYGGGPADLLAVTPGGWEVRWRDFMKGDEERGAAFRPLSLTVHGRPVERPALLHSSGAVLVPEQALQELGAQRISVDAISRTYWTWGTRSGDYTLGRTAASLGGKPLSLTLPVQVREGGTYVDVAFARDIAGGGAVVEQGRLDLGLRDIGGHWARPVILQLLRDGIVSGTDDGRYLPDATLTRAAFVKLLAGARGLQPKHGAGGGFADTGGHWLVSQGYLGAALEAGIVVGADYPGDRFGPDEPISREEMAVMAVRAMGLDTEARARSLPLNGGAALVGEKRFTDAAGWGRPGHIAIAVEQGIVTGYPEAGGSYAFRPGRQATRAEAAVMVLRTLQR